jgi:hypothetical protein
MAFPDGVDGHESTTTAFMTIGGDLAASAWWVSATIDGVIGAAHPEVRRPAVTGRRDRDGRLLFRGANWPAGALA